MIIVHLSDPLLRQALRRAARPDEDVFWDAKLVDEALLRGFPRLIVRRDGEGVARGRAVRDVPELVLDRGMLQAWERTRTRVAVPRTRLAHLAASMEHRIRDHADRAVWVDRALADISRLSGGPLPAPFRGMARRVLEFPCHYADLGALERLTGLSRGAVKARFRRRGMASPTQWLRRLRVLAAAHALSDPSVSTSQAAYRLGFRDSGNFCRLVRTAGGLTPSEAREPGGRLRLLAGVASGLTDPEQRRGWDSLGSLFLEGVA